MTCVFRAGVLSDTHLSRLSAELLAACRTHFAGVDLILHAGDIVAPVVLEELGARGWEVVAVRGNMDFQQGLGSLPQTRVVELGTIRVGICHGGGSASGIRSRILQAFGSEIPQVVVYGHTHRPDDTVEQSVRFVNPGSPTDQRFAAFRSLGVLTVRAGQVDFDVIRL